MSRVTLLMLVTLASVPALAAPAAASLPRVYSSAAANLYGLTHVNGSPTGGNRFTCGPSAAHQYAVAVVHCSISFPLNPLDPVHTAMPVAPELGG